MLYGNRYWLLLLFLFTAPLLQAQDITGTWQGSLGTEQFLQLNIIQNGDKICGYTWDTVHKQKHDYCKAYFEGTYDKSKQEWLLTGTSFMKHTGSHVLSRIRLKMSTEDGENTLKGVGVGFTKRFTLPDDPFFDILLPSREDPPRTYVNPDPGLPVLVDEEPPEDIFLEKVSNRPAQVLPHMLDCFSAKELSLKMLPISTVQDIPENYGDLTVSFTRNDSPAIVLPTGRGERIISRITVKDTLVQLQVYDNAMIDGDTVSILVNDKIVMEHRRLSEAPIFVNINLNANMPLQKISLFAENLGSIPPNTALLVFMSGGKRYELFAKATLEDNAVLYFEYKKE